MDKRATVKNIPAWKSPWVIGWIASIFIVLGVNIAMVYLAMDSNPGLVVEDYYERGQDYEKNMLTKLAREPDWLMTIDVPRDLAQGVPAPVGFSVVDKAGVPVRPDQVTFYAYRPSDANRDFSAQMNEQAKGLYRAKVVFPLKGGWDSLVSVRQGGEEYTGGRRIQVAAAARSSE